MMARLLRAIEALRAKPPWLNEPGAMLYFSIDGRRTDGMEPDELAATLNKWRDQFFNV